MGIKEVFLFKLNSVLSLFGFEVKKKVTHKKENDKLKRWKLLMHLPEVPTIIDIGVGDEGTPILYSYYPNARYIFIDPLEECRESVVDKLNGGDNIYIATALGSVNSTASITVAEKPSRSTFLQNNNGKNLAQERRKVPVKRLDDVLDSIEIKNPIGIKIDTEGFELEVLKGAEKTLHEALFVIVEFHFEYATSTYNPQAYTLQDIIDYMKNAGYIAHFMIKDGRNMVFVRKSS